MNKNKEISYQELSGTFLFDNQKIHHLFLNMQNNINLFSFAILHI